MKLGRIREMSVPEIAGRGRQQMSKWIDRFGPVVDRGAMPLTLPEASERFFAGLHSAESAGALAARLPEACSALIRSADAILDGQIRLLGFEPLTFADPIDWHADPITGRRPPLRHWTRINPLDAAAAGDCRITWELSRQQWCVTLGQAYWLTGDIRYARRAVAVLTDWTRRNPYGIGINWTSSLEAALRFIAWSWTLLLIRESGAVSSTALETLIDAMRLHATHVRRYLSHYFSPNTHLTGEALGLFYAGVLFADHPAAHEWRDTGRRILDREAERQILADGVYMEQATCYQRYTAEIYLHYLLLAERNGLTVPALVRARVERLVECLLWLVRPDGSLPPIGDADGGWLLPLATRAAGDCRGVFGLAAVVFGREDFAWAAGELPVEVAWMLGDAGIDAFDRLQPAEPAESPSRAFTKGGCVVMRSGWDRDARYLTVDAGPLGCAFAGAHGHADLLSIQCSAFGEPYFVDAGTYAYTLDAQWRDYLRSSRAHSTVLVDGRSQAEPGGPFRWQQRPSATLRSWVQAPDLEIVDAEHGAYRRLDDPVTHRRRIVFVRRRYWVIADDLSGNSEHDVEVRFQFAARPVRLSDGGWVSSLGADGAGLWLASFSTVPLDVHVRCGSTDPIDGWISPDYGRLAAAPVVIYAASARLPLRVISLVMPVEELADEPPDVREYCDPDGSLAGLHLVEEHDLVRFDPSINLTRVDARSPR